MVLTAIVVLPGAQAVRVAAPQAIPNSPLVSVTVTFDDPDLTQLRGLVLHFRCDASGSFSEALDVALPGDLGQIRDANLSTEHALLKDILDGAGGGYGYGYDPLVGGYGYLVPGFGDATHTGYGYLTTGQSGYGYASGEHGTPTGETDGVASGYGYGYGGSGYGYGYDSGSLTFVLEMRQAAFVADEECTLVLEVVPVGNPSGSFEGPRSDPFTPRVSPTASAGDDFDVAALQANVTLDGSGSLDGNNGPEPLTYEWTQVAGPAVVLNSTTVAEPRFTAPAAAGTLTFRLRVFDGLDNDTDDVDVTVRNVVANAGPDRFGTEGRRVTLDGSGSSTSSGFNLTYQWTQTDGPGVTLANATTAHPSFTVPDVAGPTPATFKLVAHAGPYSDDDTVVITFIEQEPPTVTAPADATITEGIAFTLAANAVDRNDDPLTYVWDVLSGPPGTFSSRTVLRPVFTPPEVDDEETTVLRLTVSDGFFTRNDTVTYTVRDNEAPIARAGLDATVDAGSLLTLHGEASFDPDGDGLTYSWSIESGAAGVSLNDTSLPTPSLSTSSLAAGVASLRLTVTDPFGATGSDRVEVLVRPVPALEANAGPNLGVEVGQPLVLDGEASTGSGPLTYVWTPVTLGAPVPVAIANTPRATLTAPLVPTLANQPLVYNLTVSNGTASDYDHVEVTVHETGGAPLGAEAYYLHTQDCVLADAAPVPLPLASSNTATQSDDHAEDTELCLRQSLPGIGNTAVAYAGSTTRAIAQGTDLSGTVYVSFALPSDSVPGALGPANVTIDLLGPGGAVLATATGPVDTSLAFGLVDTLPALEPVFAPFAFDTALTGALHAGAFTFRVSVEPTFDAGYLVGLEPGRESAFEFGGEQGSLPAGSPTANAGADANANEGTFVTLDGIASLPGNGTVTDYFWSQVAGPRVALGNGGSPSRVAFQAPTVQQDTTLRFRLVVENSAGLTSLSDTVTVTVKNVAPALAAPVVDVTVGGSGVFQQGALVRLNATVSDAPTDFVQQRWTQTAGGIPVGGTVQPSLSRVFLAPHVAATTTFRFALTARDHEGLQGIDSIAITVLGDVVPPVDDGDGDGGSGIIVLPTPDAVPVVDVTVIPPVTPPTPTTPGGVVDLDRDSDGDGVPDRIELMLGTDPFKASSVPSFDISSQLKVRRIGGANVLDWEGRTGALGYQLWSSNSPYALLATTGNDQTSFADTNGKLTTKYKLTFFVERTAAGGYLTDASGLSTLSGWDESGGNTIVEPASSGGGQQVSSPGLPGWAFGAVVLGAAAVVCALAIALFAGRRK